MKSLHLFTPDPRDDLAQHFFARTFNTHSPALDSFTDFALSPPPRVSSTMPAHIVENIMRAEHLRLKLVVDDDDHLLGLVSRELLNEQEIMKQVAAGRSRDNLTVKDFMLAREAIKALAYDELKKATLADVLQALRNQGQHFCLVVDNSSHQVRGVISAHEIARLIGTEYDQGAAPTFAKMFHALKTN